MVIFDRLKVLTAARYKKANGSQSVLDQWVKKN